MIAKPAKSELLWGIIEQPPPLLATVEAPASSDVLAEPASVVLLPLLPLPASVVLLPLPASVVLLPLPASSVLLPLPASVVLVPLPASSVLLPLPASAVEE
jgi:hypothetical protein